MKLLTKLRTHFVANLKSMMLALVMISLFLTSSSGHADSSDHQRLLGQYLILKEKKITNHKSEDDLKRLAILENSPYDESVEYLIKLVSTQIEEIIDLKLRGHVNFEELRPLEKALDLLARLLNKSYQKHETILTQLNQLEKTLSFDEWRSIKTDAEAVSYAFLHDGPKLPSIDTAIFAGVKADPAVIDERALALLVTQQRIPLEKNVVMNLIYYFSVFKVAEVSRFYHQIMSTNMFDSERNSHQIDPEIFGRILEVISKEPAYIEYPEFKVNLGKLKLAWHEAAEKLKDRDPENSDRYRMSAGLLESLLKPRTADALAAMKLPSLESKINAKMPLNAEDTLKTELKKLNQFREAISKVVIGQAEAIEALFDIEFSKYLFPHRKTPELLYLMGEPGTGKDTLAEAYVDYLQGYKGAHQDHLMRLRVTKDHEGINAIMGSSTGYIGSNDMPAFIRFLVNHSGGRYLIEDKHNGQPPIIIENKDWKGENLPGFDTPGKAVVFVNEFHNWSSEAKDEVLKQFIEKGFVNIKRPGNGVAQIFVPVTIIFASNEGMNLISQTDRTGRNRGGKLNTDEKQTNWQLVRNDKKVLKDAIRATNAGQIRSANPKGISPEMLNRIPESRLVIMKPLLPSEIAQIIEIKLRELEARFQDGVFKGLKLTWSKSLIQYVQEFNGAGAEGARVTGDNINELIERTLKDAILAGKLSPGTQELNLDVKMKSVKGKQSAELVFQVPSGPEQKLTETGRQVIAASTKLKQSKTLTSKEVDEIKTLAARLQKHVVGQDLALQRIANQLIIAKADGGDINKPRAAQKFFALGWSSTGKTETAKAIARELFGSESALKVTDFSQVRSIQDIKEKILGTTDFNGEAVPSEFMLEYDKRHGKMIIVLDEIANAPEGVLNALYDVLREANVSTFSDGKVRPMTNVIIFMTGNAGENSSKGIPQDVSLEQQMAAFEEVYRQTMKDPAIQRMTLEKHFSNAFINRVGEQNFFFYSPLGIESLRKLSHLKVQNALKDIANSAYAWKIRFRSVAAYLGFLDTIERESMIVREQGSSIDRGVDNFINALRLKLILEKAPPKSVITIDEPELTSSIDGERREYKINAEIQKGGKLKQVWVEVLGRIHTQKERRNKASEVLTAYHEAGHEVVRQALFNGEFASNLISTRPGVTQIGGDWIQYDGIAKSDVIERVRLNYANVVRHMAVNAGGYVAENIMTSDNEHNAGKSNDMERASQLAQRAILEWGLSEAWGTSSRPPNMSLTEFIADLSEERRGLLEREISRMIMDAEILARAALLNNMKIFREMGYKLAELGTLDRNSLNELYSKTPLVRADKFKWAAAEKKAVISRNAIAKNDENSRRREMFSNPAGGVRWRNPDSVPDRVADNDEILKQERIDRLAKVTLDIPTSLIAGNDTKESLGIPEKNRNSKTESGAKTDSYLESLAGAPAMKCELIFNK